MKAADRFANPTTAPNQLWQTDFEIDVLRLVQPIGIPIGASVRRIESDDCSYLMKRPPHPRERFF